MSDEYQRIEVIAGTARRLFRICAKDFTRAEGIWRAKKIPAGTTVFAATRSAMFDGRVFPVQIRTLPGALSDTGRLPPNTRRNQPQCRLRGPKRTLHGHVACYRFGSSPSSTLCSTRPRPRWTTSSSNSCRTRPAPSATSASIQSSTRHSTTWTRQIAPTSTLCIARPTIFWPTTPWGRISKRFVRCFEGFELRSTRHRQSRARRAARVAIPSVQFGSRFRPEALQIRDSTIRDFCIQNP